MFRKLARFDYTPKECFQYHEAIEKHIVPLMREIDEERRDKLGVDPLRPWDMAVDPEGRQPLRPFKTAKELIHGCKGVFESIHPEFAKNFGQMAELNLLDLESRKGKAPGGYNSELMEVRLPFIFMNGVGRDIDLRTMLHESGHAFHVFATRNANLHHLYREHGIPIEFAEVASQAMDLIAGEHLEGIFYNPQEAKRSMREQAKYIPKLLAWVATIDSFQHWIYTHPGHSRGERREYWVRLRERFGGLESYEGYEDVWRSRWQRQLHLYLVPFYYIEYGIALLGALGVWSRYRKDPKGAIESYKRALSLGGSKPLPELFQTAGVPFDFGPKTVEPYARELRSILRAS
jgi:oligoendopeptidase F